MRGIAKRFGGVAVLDRVDFAVQPGEVVALLGSNGAGKSTLMKILCGVYQRDGGSIAIDGSDVSLATPRDAAASGISFLPQEISVVPEMTVAENICLGAMPTRRGLVDDAAMQSRAEKILGQLGFAHISPRAFAVDLSVAERRIVEIARALAADASVLVMDEPTASLTEHEAEMIFRIIRRLQQQNTSVVYISHYLKEVFAIADRIEVLRDGRNAGSFLPRQSTVATVVEAMLGTVAGDMFAAGARRTPGETILAVEHLGFRTSLAGVSLRVARGEKLGVFGLVGSGVEVLGRVIYGAEGTRHQGTMRFAGKPYAPRSPADGKRAGIGFVSAERKKDGIIADLTLRENIVAPFQRRFGNGWFTSRRRETLQSLAMIKSFGIRTRGPEQEVRTLSGGNQQKVCLARWLDPSVQMLILEEPTRGVDVGARREIYAQLSELARNGLAVLVLSSDVEEVAGLCDRMLVLDRGAIAAEFPAGTDAATLLHATTTGAAA
jgi:ribose transport system ATP-binding protein